MIGLPRLLKMQRLTILTQKLLKKQEKATKKKIINLLRSVTIGAMPCSLIRLD